MVVTSTSEVERPTRVGHQRADPSTGGFSRYDIRPVCSMKRIAALVALLLIARALSACQCGHRPPVAEALRDAAAVFEGKVVNRRMVLAQEHEWFFAVPEYEFRVSRAWKGVAAPTIHLLGGYSNCAYVFRKDTSYLVFVGPHWERPDRLSSSICDPTKRVSEASSDLSSLGTPTVVFVNTNFGRRVTADRMRAYVIAGAAVFGNLRHASERGSWSYLDIRAAALAILALTALVFGILNLRRWRRAVTALIVCLLLALAGLIAAGHSVYQDTWFSRYVE